MEEVKVENVEFKVTEKKSGKIRGFIGRNKVKLGIAAGAVVAGATATYLILKGHGKTVVEAIDAAKPAVQAIPEAMEPALGFAEAAVETAVETVA